MLIGLVSGVCNITWSVLRDKKISLLMFWVEILLSNATTRRGDLCYVEFITWSCHCPTLHFLGHGPEQGAETRQGCHTPACSAVVTVALPSQLQSHRHGSAHGSVIRATDLQSTVTGLINAWGSCGISAPGSYGTGPKLLWSLCFREPPFFLSPTSKKSKGTLSNITPISLLRPNLCFLLHLFSLNIAHYSSLKVP